MFSCWLFSHLSYQSVNNTGHPVWWRASKLTILNYPWPSLLCNQQMLNVEVNKVSSSCPVIGQLPIFLSFHWRILVSLESWSSISYQPGTKGTMKINRNTSKQTQFDQTKCCVCVFRPGTTWETEATSTLLFKLPICNFII